MNKLLDIYEFKDEKISEKFFSNYHYDYENYFHWYLSSQRYL